MFAPPAIAQDATWNGALAPGDTNYGSGGNWIGGVPAGGVAATATFGTSGSTIVTLDGALDIGAFRIQNSQAYTFNKNTADIVTLSAGMDIQAGSSAIFNNAAGTLQFLGGSAQTSVFSITGGVVEFQNASNAGSATINVANTGALAFFGGASAGSATITTSGQLDFLNSSSAGNASITATAGMVQFGAFSNAGASNISAFGNAIVSFGGSSIGGTSAITLSNNAQLDISGHGVGVTIGSIASADATTQIALGANALTVGGNATTTFAGVIAGAGGSLTKTGAGTLTLTNANSYTGGTTIDAGAVNIRNSTALGTGAVSVASGAALELQSGGTITVSNALTLSGTGVANGGALRNISGNNNYNGAITLSSASLVNSDFGIFRIVGGITGAGQDLTFRSGLGSIDVASAITTGTGGVTVDGGSVQLVGANTYTGVTTVNAGTLFLQNGAAITDTGAVVVNSAGGLRLFSSETIGSLAGSGNVRLASGSTLTTGGDNTPTTFSGVISEVAGAGSLVKTGSGTFTLTGANTYTGGTTINGGTLSVGADNNLGGTAGGLTTRTVVHCTRRETSRRHATSQSTPAARSSRKQAGSIWNSPASSAAPAR